MIIYKMYVCPTCGATKELGAHWPSVNGMEWPKDLPCGWRGCEDRAVPNDKETRDE